MTKKFLSGYVGFCDFRIRHYVSLPTFAKTNNFLILRTSDSGYLSLGLIFGHSVAKDIGRNLSFLANPLNFREHQKYLQEGNILNALIIFKFQLPRNWIKQSGWKNKSGYLWTPAGAIKKRLCWRCFINLVSRLRAWHASMMIFALKSIWLRVYTSWALIEFPIGYPKRGEKCMNM